MGLAEGDAAVGSELGVVEGVPALFEGGEWFYVFRTSLAHGEGGFVFVASEKGGIIAEIVA